MKKKNITAIGCLLAAAIQLPLSVQAQETTDQSVEVWGALISSNDNVPAYGIYSFNTKDATMNRLTEWDSSKAANGSGTFFNDEYHFVNYSTFLRYYFIRSYCYSTDDWYMEDSTYYETESNIDPIALAMANDPTTGRNMGLFFNSSATGFVLGEFNYENLTMTPIKSTDTIFVAMACNQQGQYYGISKGGALFEIDKQTGEPAMIARTGMMPELTIGDHERQSAAFDPSTNKLYWAAALQNGTRALYEVDTQTAQATKVLDFPNGEMFSAIYFPQPKAKAEAPAEVMDAAALFEGASLTGSVRFTMPQTTFSGNELTGNLHYYIKVEGKLVKSGQAAAGEEVKVEGIVVPEGDVTVAIYTSNQAGNSPRAKLHFWAGYDVPMAPANVKLVIDNASGVATLTWDAPTEGIHGGFVDTENLTYNITRYPELVVVGQGYKGNEFTEQLSSDNPVTIHYVVEAINGNQISREAKSNNYPLGAVIEPPYKQEFETSESLAGFTIIPRADRKTSWFRPDNMYYPFVRSYWDGKDCDDWLITPGLLLQEGKNYEFSFIARCEPSNYGTQVGKNRFECAWGDAPTVEAMNIVVEPVDLNTIEWTTFKAVVSPKQTGVYYFGIHDISLKMEFYMDVDDIAVVETQEEIPSAIMSAEGIAPAAQEVYDIQGRLVSRAYAGSSYENSNEGHNGNLAPSTKKGIYIVNGKKIIVK